MKVIVAGDEIELGATEAKPTIGIVDYSRRETDDFGVTTVVRRGFARRMSVRAKVPFSDVDALQSTLAALRAQPVTWVADERFASLAFDGFYKDFAIDLAVPPVSFCTLTVEGLTETEAGADPGGDPAADGNSSTLQLLQPALIDDSVLTAINVPEDDQPVWSAGTTYPLGARVIRAHRQWESLVVANLGNEPAAGSAQWMDIGPTNRWAMFDDALGTLTEAAGSIIATLDPVAPINALALLDVTSATVRVQAAGYDRTIAPSAAGSAMFLDIPAIASAITVTVTGPGIVSVGTMMIGSLVGLGVTEASPSAGINDYSRKETDEFGDVTVVERAWAKRMDARALLRTDAVDLVFDRIATVRGRPCLWIGAEGVEALSIYGFFKDFSIEVDENVSTLSLSIEGLSKAAQLAPLDSPPYLVTVFQNATAAPAPPPFDAGEVPPGWTLSPTELPEGQFRWSTQAKFLLGIQQTAWTLPVKVGGVSWQDVVDDDPAHPKPEDGATKGMTPEERDELEQVKQSTAAPSITLTRPTVTLWAYENGIVTDFSNANGLVKVVSGGVDVTASAALSATATGCTGTINSTTASPVAGQPKGYYRVTAMPGDAAKLTLTAVYGGKTVTAEFQLTKIRAGYQIVASTLPTDNLFEGRLVYRESDGKLYRYKGGAWTAAISGADIDNATLTTAKFANGIEPVTMVTSVPSTKSTNTVFNTTDGKLYRWNGSAYVAAVPAGDVSGKIAGTQIEDNAIQTPHLAADSVTAGKIAAAAVNARELAAGSVTASRIVVADLSNLVINNWTGGDMDGWGMSAPFDMTYGAGASDLSAGVAGNRVRIDNTAAWLRSPQSTCSAGEKFYAEVWVYRQTTFGTPSSDSLAQVRFDVDDGSGSLVANYATFGSTSVNNSWIKLSGIVTAPANAKTISMWLRPIVSGSVGRIFFARPILRRASSGELIVDGDVLARHLGSGSVTTDKLDAGAVTAAKINVTSLAAISANLGNVAVSGNLLVDGTVNGVKIADLAVQTAKLANNAATVPVSAYTDGEATGSDGVWFQAQAVTISTTGAPVEIFASGTIELASSGSIAAQTMEFRILRSGTEIRSQPRSYAQRISSTNYFSGSIGMTDNPIAGTYTYSVEVKIGTSATPRISKRYLKCTELKK